MSKRCNPAADTGGGYPGLRSKRAKLAPLLPHERDYLSLPTTDSLPHNPIPPAKEQHHHRYDLRVRPPRPQPPKPPVNGHRPPISREAPSIRGNERWRNAHSYSVNYQLRLPSSHTASSRTQRRPVNPAPMSPGPQRKRRKQAPPNENDLVCQLPSYIQKFTRTYVRAYKMCVHINEHAHARVPRALSSIPNYRTLLAEMSHSCS